MDLQTDVDSDIIALSRIDGEIVVILGKIAEIESDTANHLPLGSFWKYTPKSRKCLDKLALDIANLTAEKRQLQGRPVPCNGYSGRKSNRWS